MNAMDFSLDLESEIEAAYKARLTSNPLLPHLGWRFLYSPKRVLSDAKVAFLGVNPGGSTLNPNHGVFSAELGSAYRRDIEEWGKSSSLQDQAMALFQRIKVVPEDVLAGNLVPFRSPDESGIKKDKAAIAFGTKLWHRVFAQTRPPLIITMGQLTNLTISGVLGVQSIETYPVGWGSFCASRGTFNGGTWIGLPHLSHFKIMKRRESQQALDQLFEGL